MSEDCHDSNNFYRPAAFHVHHRIIAECANCAWRFEVNKGLECPHCHSNIVAWATREETVSPYEAINSLRAMLNRTYDRSETITESDRELLAGMHILWD
jgi:hypothetical protein